MSKYYDLVLLRMIYICYIIYIIYSWFISRIFVGFLNFLIND